MSDNVQAEPLSRWPETVRLTQLFADALRMRIVGECNNREMSPQSYYRDVGGATAPKVFQAFELLVQYDWLTPTRTENPDSEEPERFYRGTGVPVVDEDLWLQFPDSTKALITGRIFETLTMRVKEALKSGTIAARPEAHMTWMPLELDQQGWDTVIARFDAAFHALLEEREMARARIEESGEKPIPATVGLFAFESPEHPPKWR